MLFMQRNHSAVGKRLFRKLQKTSFIVSIFSASSLIACAGSQNPTSVSASSCSTPAAGVIEKLHLGNASDAASSLQAHANILSDTTLASGTDFTVTIKDRCTNIGPISREISRYSGATPAGVRSYKWKNSRAMTSTELSRLASQDSCVTMISQAADAKLIDDAPQQSIEPPALPTDPGVVDQMHLTAIDAKDAYQIFYDPNTGLQQDIVIAIIDSGVDLNHEDLKANIWTNPNEIPANGIDDDLNGYIDDVHGYNFASGIGDPSPQVTAANSAWQWAHGSRVAGLAAAVGNNGLGGSGVMPNAKIMALNAMGTSAGFSQSDEANAIRYAVDNGARVINLSLGGSAAGADFTSALQYAVSHGAVVVAAAGNDSTTIGSGYSAAGLAPTIDGLISIGNIRSDNLNISPTSNYSTTYVELGAPGTNTVTQGLYSISPTTNSSYGYFSGTSAATPVAAGAAALAIGLIETRGYKATPSIVKSLLLSSATKVPALTGYFKDGNALNIASLAKMINQEFPFKGVVNRTLSKPDGAANDASAACAQ